MYFPWGPESRCSACSFCHFMCINVKLRRYDAAVYIWIDHNAVMMINLHSNANNNYFIHRSIKRTGNYYGKINQINLCISCAAFYWNHYIYICAASVHIYYNVGQTEQQKPNRIGITNNSWAYRNSNRRPEPVKRIINVANAIMLALLITLRRSLDLRTVLVLNA